MGQVLQAGVGQAPARQAAIGAGLPKETPADTINKVCASSIRAVQIADTMIRAGDHEVIVTGGMESMSNAPYLLKKARFGYRLGHGELIDSMIFDGLTDAYDSMHMVQHNSMVSRELGITREEQDAWALRSQQRAAAAQDEGRYDDEIVPVGGVTADEGIRRDTSLESLAKLKPVFDPERNDGRQCTGSQRRLLVRDRHVRGVRRAARSRGAGVDRLAGLRRRRLRVPRPHSGERRGDHVSRRPGRPIADVSGSRSTKRSRRLRSTRPDSSAPTRRS